MKSTTLLRLLAPVLVLAFAVAGCSDSPSMSGSGASADIDDQFGGYTATDELPAFGATDLAGVMLVGEEVDDPLVSDADLDSLRERDGARAYAVAIRWGMLDGDSTITDVTDWSGSIALTRGAIGVRRLIRFEREQDYVVRPRTSRSELEWVSKTTVHFDGLLLTVVVPPPPPDTDVADNILTFTTGPYTKTFNITAGDLDSLDEIVDVDAAGNQLAFQTRILRPRPCEGGPLHGFWVLDSTGTAGRFFGGWTAADGRPHGHLRGHFEVRDGGRVFFGKIIGPDGAFVGRLRGRWGPAEDSPHHGWFAGEWSDANGNRLGRLRGGWSDTPGPGEHRDREHEGEIHHPVNGDGFFGGWWERVCLIPM